MCGKRGDRLAECILAPSSFASSVSPGPGTQVVRLTGPVPLPAGSAGQHFSLARIFPFFLFVCFSRQSFSVQPWLSSNSEIPPPQPPACGDYRQQHHRPPFVSGMAVCPKLVSSSLRRRVALGPPTKLWGHRCGQQPGLYELGTDCVKQCVSHWPVAVKRHHGPGDSPKRKSLVGPADGFRE